ncbi:MAG: heme-binding domain-containing protein, partial [Anaerolineales bacterium]
APVSWWMGKHIREGKEQVNFSEFGHLEKKEMIRVLNDMCKMVKEGSMPIPSYRLMHKDAALSEEDAKLLCEWSDTEATKLLGK